MAQKIWEWNKWYGGLGDYSSIMSVTDQQKYSNESYSIDGRKNPEGVQLGSYFTTSENIVSWSLTCYLDLAELGTATLGSSWVVKCTDTGNIYLNGTLKYSLTGAAPSKKIEAISYVGSTIYYFSWNGDIHKSDITLTTFVEIWKTFPIVLNVKPVVYRHNSLIYIATLYNIYTFDGTTVSASPVFVLEKSYQITGITFWQEYMNIYGKNDVNGIKALWDPDSGSNAPAFSVPYTGLPVLWVDGEGGVDRAVLGVNESYTDFYMIQGTSLPQMLVSNTEGSVNVRTFNGIVKHRMGITYLGGTINGQGCLFSYGSYFNGFPPSLQVECRANVVTAILPRSTEVKFGNYKAGDANPYRSWVVRMGDNLTSDKYTDIGEVVSLPFTWGRRSLKSLLDVEVCFKTDALSTYSKHGGQVTLYARTSPSGSWTTIRVINTTTETDGFVIISQQEFGTLASFNQLEYRLRLEPVYDGVRYSISPLVTSITTRYDDNLKGS